MELLLNAGLEAEVRAVWQRLHATGLRSLATHTHPSNAPHITLATAEELPPDLALQGLPVDIVLDNVIVLGRNVAWRVRPTESLRQLHRTVWQSVDDQNPLHAPENWIPHVSLALRTDPAGYPRTLPETHGQAVVARTYDSISRTVTALDPA
ncbi:2'-5' RNA ligase family protein [Actinoplanes sp. TFC3]|uniref:2'-5' RNA ligase family protein n=1 Tax=Actinoplanes sp. TFC3 TaxID=1710355 RepID=UPI0009E93D18|nr:2'-5' RNA ligase family protein [Actinoplanes sp. TFC3]